MALGAITKTHQIAVIIWKFNPFTPDLKIQILPTIQEKMYEWCTENWYITCNKLSIATFSILYDTHVVKDWRRKLKLITPGNESQGQKLYQHLLTLSHRSYFNKFWIPVVPGQSLAMFSILYDVHVVRDLKRNLITPGSERANVLLIEPLAMIVRPKCLT